MAVKAKLTRQMPWVGTEDEADVIDYAADTGDLSKAKIIREAVDYVFGLRDGKLPEGLTVAEAVAQGQALLSRPSPHGADARA